MSCTLTQNINPKCGELFGGGIKSEIRLYKLPNAKAVINGLEITDIIADDYYLMFADGVEYKQESENGVFTHTLTGKVLNVSTETQNALFASKNDNFLVVYRIKGNNTAKAFGVRFGAKIANSQTINNEEGSFSITITAKSNTPLYSVSENAFDYTNKTFAPFYKATGEFCEASGGVQTGFKAFNYVVRQNINGEALDANNKLCETTGNKQAAYILSGVAVGNYQKIGEFGKGEIVEGVQTLIYDNELCANETSGTISVNQNTFNLNTTTAKTATIEVSCEDSWSVLEAMNITTVQLDKVNGIGNGSIVISNPTGGSETIRIINNRTMEIVSVTINSFVLNTISSRIVDNNELLVNIPCQAIGGANPTFTAETEQSGVEIEVVGNVISFTSPSVDIDTTFAIVVTHSNDNTEKKTISVTLLKGDDNSPKWVVVAQYCEVE